MTRRVREREREREGAGNYTEPLSSSPILCLLQAKRSDGIFTEDKAHQQDLRFLGDWLPKPERRSGGEDITKKE